MKALLAALCSMVKRMPCCRFNLNDAVWAVYFGFFLLGFQLNGLAKSLTGSFVFDKILFILFIALVAIIGIRRRSTVISRAFLVFLLYCMFCAMYSFLVGSNVGDAIFLDLLSQSKPFLCFFGMLYISPVVAPRQLQLIRWLAIFAVLQAVVVVALGKIWFYYYHPSNMASSISVAALLYYFTSPISRKTKWITVGIMSIGIFSARSKFYMFYALYLVFVIGGPSLLNFKLSPKRMLMYSFGGVLAIAVASGKILYYAKHMQMEQMARPFLYWASFRILIDHFPFGSGLATLGNIASWTYYSKTYAEYGLDRIWGLNPIFGFSFAMDAYFPSLAQFGVFGICFLIANLKQTLSRIKLLEGNARLSALMIVVYLLLDSTADTTLTSFRGVFAMMSLGLILSTLNGDSRKIKTANYPRPIV